MKNEIQIREVRISLRFKIAIVSIILIIFISLIIGSAVFKQHKENFNNTLKNKTSSILSSSISDISKLLKLNHNPNENEDNSSKKDELQSGVKERLSKFKGDPFIDSIFLIDINKYLTQKIKFSYYDFEKNELINFNKENKCKDRKKFGFTNPCRYKSVNKFLHKHLIKNIEPDLLLVESEGEIITGIPIFKERFDARYFKKYLSYKNVSFSSKKDVENYKKDKRHLINYFNNRLIKSNQDFNYEIIFDNEKKINSVFSFLTKYYEVDSLSKERKKELNNKLTASITSNLKDNKVKIFNIKELIGNLKKEYSFDLKENDSDTRLWHSFFYFLNRNNIQIHTVSLDDLAVLSYKNDLMGVVGLILKKDKFVKDFGKSTNETLSILFSILFRMILLAFFLPAFFTEPISRLTNFAIDIKEKNVKKKLLFHGSDELGQLADSLNLLVQPKRSMGVLQEINIDDDIKDFKNYLFKDGFPESQKLEFGSYYINMNGFCESYYDVFEVNEDITGIAIAETKLNGQPDKQIFAMPAMKTLLRSYVNNSNNLKAIAHQINNYFHENNFNAAMFFGLLKHRDNVLTYFSAGHKKSIVLRDGKLKSLPAGGPTFGETHGKEFYSSLELRELKFNSGDYLIQYSNGVLNANDSVGNRFSEERFLKTIYLNNGESPQKMIDSVVSNLNEFTGEIKQKNDIALLALRIKD